MSLLDAINAAAASLQSEKKSEPKGAPKSAPKAAQPKASAKAAPKTDTPKQKGGASYVIPAEFKQAIEDYLNGRPDMADKLSKEGKTIDGCCDYIFDVMRKRAEKQRGGKSAVGLYASPDEIFGMAVHYYDEKDEDLKKELKSK
jgi:hypothetical protein